ncbi:MAG: InlB B-repeat-containing protein, partial [Lachnospiraceae bacterium]|nr:InlB B-repeat-containing protein [Lachnospiraceae bacterium]
MKIDSHRMRWKYSLLFLPVLICGLIFVHPVSAQENTEETPVLRSTDALMERQKVEPDELSEYPRDVFGEAPEDESEESKPFLLSEQNELALITGYSGSDYDRVSVFDTFDFSMQKSNGSIAYVKGINHKNGIVETHGMRIPANNEPEILRYPYDDLKCIQSIGFDADGSGRKKYIASVGFQNNELCLCVQDSTDGSSLFTDVGTIKQAMSAHQWVKDNYIAITAGDYDGNGKDSVIVYLCGDDANVKLVEYDGLDNSNVFRWKRRNVLTLATVLKNTQYANKSDPKYKPAVTLATGDFNGDGRDQLAFSAGTYNTSSHKQLGYEDHKCDSIEEFSTCVGIGSFNEKTSTWNFPASDRQWMYEIGDDQNSENGKTRYDLNIMHAGAIAAGDVNSDGIDEIVVAGYMSHNYAQASSNYAAAIFQNGRVVEVDNIYDTSPKQLLSAVVYRDSRSNKYTKSAMKVINMTPVQRYTFEEYCCSHDYIYAKLSMACGRTNGASSAEEVFICGALYDFSSFAPKEVYTPDFLGSKSSYASKLYINDYYKSSVNWVRNVAVGNFDGNDAGREQFVFTFWQKIDNGNKYNSIIGVVCGTDFDDKTATDGSIEYGAPKHHACSIKPEESYMSSENSIFGCTDAYGFRVHRGGSLIDDALNAVPVAVDSDQDGVLAKFRSNGYVYTDPEIIAVLEAAPYYSEIAAAGGYGAECTTKYNISSGFGNAYSSGDSVAFDVGFALESELIAGVKGSLELGYCMDWSKTYETEYTVIKTAGFEATTEDSVVLRRIPVLIYAYDIYDPEQNKWIENGMHVKVPAGSVYCQISVEAYNNFVDEYNAQFGDRIDTATNVPLVEEYGLEKIDLGEDLPKDHEGNPDNYWTNWNVKPGLEKLSDSNELSTNGGAASFSDDEETISTETTEMSHGFHFGLTILGGGKYGVGETWAGGYTNLDYRSSSGYSKITIKGSGCETTVQGIHGNNVAGLTPQQVASGYGFWWEFGRWSRYLTKYAVKHPSGPMAAVPEPYPSYEVPFFGFVVYDVQPGQKAKRRPLPPQIDDRVQEKPLDYDAYSVDDLIPGNLPDVITITKVSGDGKITYDAATKKIMVDAGLSFGAHPATFRVSNGLSQADTFFTYTVNVLSTKSKYNVEVTVNPRNSGTASATPAAGATGAEVTLSYTQELGYKFAGWDVLSGNVTIVNNKFEIGSEDVKIEAVFVPVPVTYYKVTVKTDGNGTATADPEKGPAGTGVHLTPRANAGYRFKEWTVISGGVSIENNAFTLGEEDVVVKALFEAYDSRMPDIDFGTANKGYDFDASDRREIYVKNTGDTALNITPASCIQLTGENAGQYFRLHYSSLVDFTGNSIEPGETVRLGTIDPVSGLDVGEYHAKLTFRDDDHEAPAEADVYFRVTEQEDPAHPTYYSVNVISAGHGWAKPSVSSGKTGTNVSLSVKADKGYRFDRWQVVSGGITIPENSNTFTIGTQNVVIMAIFEQLPLYSVQVSSDPVNGGAASADPTLGESGTAVTLTKAPEEGYRFVGWDVVSGNVTIENDSFVIGSEDVEIKAVFEAIPATEYSVTVTTDGHGSAVASPDHGVSGTAVSLTPTPDQDYIFKEWQVISGGVTVNDNNFTIETENVVIKAVFEVIPQTDYTVSVSAVPAAGGTASADPTFGAGGTEVTLTQSHTEGYRFVGWDVISGDVTIENDSFIIGSEDVVIEALFEREPDPVYSVTVLTDGAGRGTASADCESGTSGDEVTLTAHAEQGSVFTGWRVIAGNVTINNDKFTIASEDVVVKAVFVPISFIAEMQDIYFGTANAGYVPADYSHPIFVTNNSKEVLNVDPATCLVPDDDFADRFVAHVTYAGNSISPGETVQIGTMVPAADLAIGEYSAQFSFHDRDGIVTANAHATFEVVAADAPKQYSVSVISDGHGFGISSAPSGITGAEILLDAKPDKGYVFDHWVPVAGNVHISSEPVRLGLYGFTIGTENVIVKALFQPEDYYVCVTTDGHGTASASPVSGKPGEVITLSATPDEGWRLKEWQVISGSVTIDAAGKFSLGNSNVSVKAIFEELPLVDHTVTVTVDGNGRASASKNVGRTGEEVTLSATPDEGYYFKGWEVIAGGVTIKDNKFRIGSENVEIKAVFTALPVNTYSVSIWTVGNGTASATPATGKTGTRVTLTAAPDADYAFKEWQVISGDVTIEDNSFTIGSQDVRLLAAFEKTEVPMYAVEVETDGHGSAYASPQFGPAGTEITLSAMPEEGYHLKNWQVISGGVTVSNGKFNLQNSNAAVKAIFEQLAYAANMPDIDLGAANKGYEFTKEKDSRAIYVKNIGKNPLVIDDDSLTKSGGLLVTGTDDFNTEFTFRGTVEPGESVVLGSVWPRNGLSAGEHEMTLEFRDKEGKTTAISSVVFRVLADGEPAMYRVNVTTNGHGFASAEPVSGEEGASIRLNATADPGYQLKEWKPSKSLAIDEDEFSLPAENVSVEAVFGKITNPCTVSFDANGGTGNMQAVTVEKGDEYTLPANGFTAPRGKEFSKWDAGIPGTKITVTANRTIKAVWKDQVVPNPVYYTVKLNLNGGKWNGNTGIV